MSEAAEHVLPRLGALALRELTPTVINRFRLEADGVGRMSIAKTMTLLQGVLQRTCEWERLATDPVRHAQAAPGAEAQRHAARAERVTPSRIRAAREVVRDRSRQPTLFGVL